MNSHRSLCLVLIALSIHITHAKTPHYTIINNSPHTVTIILIIKHDGIQNIIQQKIIAYRNAKIRYNGLLKAISIWPKPDPTEHHISLFKANGIRQNTILLLQKNDAINDNPLRWSLNSRH